MESTNKLAYTLRAQGMREMLNITTKENNHEEVNIFITYNFTVHSLGM